MPSLSERLSSFLQERAGDLPQAPISFVTKERAEKVGEFVEEQRDITRGAGTVLSEDLGSRFTSYLERSRERSPIDFTKPAPVESPGEFLRKTKETGISFARELGPRWGVTVGLELGKLSGKLQKKSFEAIGVDPLFEPIEDVVIEPEKFGAIGKFLLGTEPIGAYEEEAEKIVGERFAKPVGALFLGLDLVPGVGKPAREGAESLLQKAAKAIAKTDNVDEIEPLVKQVFSGTDEEVSVLSRLLKDVDSEDAIATAISKQTIAKSADDAIRAGRTIDEFAEDVASEDLLNIFKRTPIANSTKRVTPETLGTVFDQYARDIYRNVESGIKKAQKAAKLEEVKADSLIKSVARIADESPDFGSFIQKAADDIVKNTIDTGIDVAKLTDEEQVVVGSFVSNVAKQEEATQLLDLIKTGEVKQLPEELGKNKKALQRAVEHIEKGIIPPVRNKNIRKAYEDIVQTIADSPFDVVANKATFTGVDASGRLDAQEIQLLNDVFNKVKAGEIKVAKPTPVSPVVQKQVAERAEQARQVGEAQYVLRNIGEDAVNPDKVKLLTEDANKMSPTTLSEGDVKKYGEIKDTINNRWNNFRTNIQDSWIKVRKLQDETKDISKAQPYERQILFHGRVASRVADVQLEAKEIIEKSIAEAKRVGVKHDELKKSVNDYLVALHAPERNAKLGDEAAGISTAAAKTRLADIDALPYSNTVKQLAQEVLDMNKKVLDVLHVGQIIDTGSYNLLRQTYKNHVPLNRIFDETEDIIDVLGGKGFDVKGAGVKRAKGSKRDVADILTNVTANLEHAVSRVEKNRVGLEVLQFARDLNRAGMDDLFKEVKPTSFTDKMSFMRDPMIMNIKEDGADVFLKIEDEAIANAFKGLGMENLPGFLKFVGAFTRFYSGVHTRFNPEFAFSNKVRDLQELAVYAASQKGIGFSGAGKSVARDAASMKDVVSYMKGADTEGAKLYKQMVEDGGTTGGLSLSTRKQVEVDIKKLEKLAKSKPRQAAQKTLELIDNWNTVFEDSSRLSVYKTALERGMTREQAALLAKESTINFNKKGTQGSIINSLYMFSNASIQGSTKLLKSMKDPKVATAVISSVAGTTYAINRWNDAVDSEWRDKVTKWDKNSNVVVVLPTTEDEGIKYITVPVSWGLKPIKVASDYFYELSNGVEQSVAEGAGGIFAAALEAYNPVGGNDAVQAMLPTVADLPVDLARNKAWHGGKIRPDWNEDLPETYQYWNATKDTKLGRTAISAARTLSDKSKGFIEVSPEDIIYAYKQFVGGGGRFASRVYNTIMEVGEKGELPETGEIPFVNRFFEAKQDDEIYGNSYERLDKIKEQQEIDRFLVREQAQEYYDEVSRLTNDEASLRAQKIKEEEPLVYEKMLEIYEEEQLGLTSLDKQIKQLGVSNGARAKYLYTEMNKLEGEEKTKYYTDMRNKKVISDTVQEQLDYLFKNPELAEEIAF